MIQPIENKNNRIVIMSENKVFSRMLTQLLQGYSVNASNQTEALTYNFNLVIIDCDSISIQTINQFLRNNLDTPILCLSFDFKQLLHSQSSSVHTMLRPFELVEFRRMVDILVGGDTEPLNPPTAHQNYEYETLQLIQSQSSVMYRDTVLKLSRKEFKLLSYLIVCANQCITTSREDILANVWSFAKISVVDVYVHYLRAKFKSAFSIDPIETVRGIGYRFLPPQNNKPS